MAKKDQPVIVILCRRASARARAAEEAWHREDAHQTAAAAQRSSEAIRHGLKVPVSSKENHDPLQKGKNTGHCGCCSWKTIA